MHWGNIKDQFLLLRVVPPHRYLFLQHILGIIAEYYNDSHRVVTTESCMSTSVKFNLRHKLVRAPIHLWSSHVHPTVGRRWVLTPGINQGHCLHRTCKIINHWSWSIQSTSYNWFHVFQATPERILAGNMLQWVGLAQRNRHPSPTPWSKTTVITAIIMYKILWHITSIIMYMWWNGYMHGLPLSVHSAEGL